MEINTRLLLLAACLSCLHSATAQNFGFGFQPTARQNNRACTTPNNRPGSCMPLHQCPPLLTIVRNQPLTAAAIQFLRQSQCGFQGREPVVCCNTANPPPTNPSNPWVELPPPTTTTRRPPPVVRPPPGGPGGGNTGGGGAVLSHRNVGLLPRDICGLDFVQRIFGGNVTGIDEFPWMALLQYQLRGGPKKFLCGGVLISNRYVLTAAHCTSKGDLRGHKLVGVRLGEYNTDTAEDCDLNYATGDQVCSDPPRDFTIEQEVAHPDYRGNSRNQHHDIAILRLNAEVPNSDYIRPICLPLENEVRTKQYVGQELTVAGWGRTETRSASPFKMKVKLPVVTNEECQTIYNRKNRTITTNQLCAGGQRGKDSCQGDSGGPMMTAHARDNSLHFYATGVVSYGPDPCGQEGWPGVYTRVSEYVGWILDQMRP